MRNRYMKYQNTSLIFARRDKTNPIWPPLFQTLGIINDQLNSKSSMPLNLHNQNMPMRYTECFTAEDINNFHLTIFYILVFAQNVDSGNTLEPPNLLYVAPLTSIHNLCLRAKNNVYPCIPKFYSIIVRCNGGLHHTDMFA